MRFCFAGFSHKRNHQLFLQEIEEEEGKYKVSFLNFKYTLQNSNFIELMVFYSFNIWQSSFELKNEENLKLKERLDLEKEIASLRATFDEQNLRNQKLKRIKLDLNSGRVTNKKPVDLIRKSQLERLQGSKSCKTSDSQNQGSFFVLPDLNMAPSEEEILYGTS
jgi:hypothetical protein